MSIIEEARRMLDATKGNGNKSAVPFVTVSYAQSLDGSIAGRPGYPLSISCPESLIVTHALRAMHDAILVGIGSILADDPQLNVRQVNGVNPQPIILDDRLRFPYYSKLLNGGRPAPWIFTSEFADESREKALSDKGGTVFRLASGNDRRVDIHALLAKLADLGISTVMVEGGAQVITSFIQSRCINQIIVCIAPVFVGGMRVIDQAAGFAPEQSPQMNNVCHEKVGSDLFVRAEPCWTTQ